MKCQNTDGGFGNSPNAPSYTESSYYAIVLLGWLDATNMIRKEDAIDFFVRRSNNEGGFGDEPGRDSDLFNTFYGIISLNMLDALEHVNRDRTIKFLISHQKIDGGFNEPDLDYSDMVHTFWSTAALDVLDALQIATVKDLDSFIDRCCNENGGFGSRPSKSSFVEYTYEAMLINWLLGKFDEGSRERAWNFVKECQNTDGRFGEQPKSPSTMSDTLWAVALLSSLNCLDRIERYKLVRHLAKIGLSDVWHRFCTTISLLYLIPSEVVIKPRILNMDIFKVQDFTVLGLARMTETEVVRLTPHVIKLDANTIQGIIDEIVSFQDIVNDVWAEGKDPTNVDFEKHLRTFGEFLYYSVLPDALERQYRETSKSFLNLSVDESLLGIPWELIFDGNEYLCIKHAVCKHIISDRYFFKTVSREPKTDLNMLLISYSAEETGDPSPDIDGLMKYMKSNQIIRVDLLHGKKANSQQIIRQILEQPYDIIHFSGHVYLDQRVPEKSGLVVSDGVLQASVLGTYLRKNPPTLAFINGCESSKENWTSGFRSESKAVGLASTFLTLGVPFIGSYFPIYDKEAIVFANSFYDHILQGLPLAEAMRNARIQAYDKFDGKGLAWASYDLFGNPIDRLCLPSEKYRSE